VKPGLNMKSLINLILCGIVSAGCSKAASDKPVAERRPDAGRSAAAPAAQEPTGKAAPITAPAANHREGGGRHDREATIDDCRHSIKTGGRGHHSPLRHAEGQRDGRPAAEHRSPVYEGSTGCAGHDATPAISSTARKHRPRHVLKRKPNGACKKELERALQVAPGSVGLEALKLITEPDTAGGTAGIIATFENTPCAAVCLPYQATACN
jgi:hypothetical protein